MTGVETFAWLVLAFADGPDCLLQASLHRLPEGPALVREDGCAVHSQQEGNHVVFWSDSRWVAIKIPAGARSLSYRWGRAVAFVNGKTVTVQFGNMGGLQTRPSLSQQDRLDLLDRWKISNPSNLRGPHHRVFSLPHAGNSTCAMSACASV
ncbi:MAG TPA: hypothetical protein VF732_08745 [Nitrospira sp.]